MFVWSPGSPPALAEYRLIVPCVSVGNVGQLAVDLFINTWRLPRIGYLDHPAILPLVGNDAFDHTHPAGHLHTAAEVYEDEEHKLVILQFRTPLIKHLLGDFCSKLLEWSREVGVAGTVVLTSSYAHERRDSQLVGEPFRFLLSSSAADMYSDLSQTLHWTVLESRAAAQQGVAASDVPAAAQGVVPEQLLFLPGAGLAKAIYKESNILNTRLCILVAFCTQGDNIPDAVAMANKVQSWIKKDVLKATVEPWILPSSWDMMYGGPSPSNLF